MKVHKLNNTRIYNELIIVALLSLIIIRIIIGESTEALQWISLVNYSGIPLSVFNLYVLTRRRISALKRGVFVIAIGLTISAGMLILTGIWKPTNLINDIILLVTLLISLPSHFYSSIL